MSFICTSESCFKLIKKNTSIVPTYINSQVQKSDICESCDNGQKFGDLVAFDRVLKKLDSSDAHLTLQKLKKEISNKLDLRNALVIGELTWAVERLIQEHAVSSGGVF